MHAHMHTCVHTHAYTSTHTQAHKHTSTHTHTDGLTDTCDTDRRTQGEYSIVRSEIDFY